MRTALFVICFFLACIVDMLATRFNLKEWPSEQVNWGIGIAIAVVMGMLLKDYSSRKKK